MTDTDTDTLIARHSVYGWSVEDTAGGRWWPCAAATELVERSRDPEAEVLRLCRETPHLGTWAQ